MSSILTNNSAMVALQTLKSINGNLEKTQSMISTGKDVASAKDNAAVWAISKTMESDVKGFKAISDSLALGESSVAVARNGSETVTDLLTQMKEKIVAAQGENVDRSKLQTDVDALRDQIASVVGAAQFNGQNLLQGAEDMNVLSSLDRASDGSVTASDIVVSRQDLSTNAGTYNTGGTNLLGGTATGDATSAGITQGAVSIIKGASEAAAGDGREFSSAGNVATLTIATDATAGDTFSLQIGDTSVAFTATATANADEDVAIGLTGAINSAGIEGVTATDDGNGVITITSTNKFEDLALTAQENSATTTMVVAADTANGAITSNAAGSTGGVLGARASEITFAGQTAVTNGDGYRVTIGSQSFDYVAGNGETMEDVARGLKIAIDSAGLSNIETRVSQETNGDWTLQVDNDTATDLTLAVDARNGGTATGGLAGVDNIDVTTDDGVEAALSNIETMIGNSINAAAALGSAQGRIETQSDFISKLTDSLKSGIGSMVDADMEEASARLQALQVQQQLGIQSLSIANQAPQSILSLFR